MALRILQYILRLLARSVLWRYKPTIVGITGSVGKTSTKEAIYAVLQKKYSVAQSRGNFNNEIGIPLSILGEDRAYGKNIFGWALVVFRAVIRMLFKSSYPEMLVLEMGLDRPGDIRALTSYITPSSGVVTAIGEIPVHVEFFSGPQAVIREKRVLVESVPEKGTAILNFDDEVVLKMKDKAKSKVLTYGFGQGADVRVTHYEMRSDEEGNPEGISFKVDYKGNTVPVRLNNVFGKHQVYSALAAFCVGIVFNINLVEISDALSGYESPRGRMRLLKGVRDSWIIDDTYNAAPLSMMAALETLGELPAKRKIVVLGDMLEIGKYTVEAHQSIGEDASKVADIIFTVGLRAKFISDEARSRRFAAKNILHFNESQEAGLPLQKMIRPGDLILIKGSRAMKMEKIVEEIMAYPRRQKKLLVS